MSSTVSLPSSFALPAQSVLNANLLLSGVPEELAALPVGTELPAVLMPPESSADFPVLNVTMPDGSVIEIPVKLNKIPTAPIEVSLKIADKEAKDLLSVQIKHLPNVPDAPKALETGQTVSSAGAGHPYSSTIFEATPLQTLPESAVQNLPPQIAKTVAETSRILDPNVKISFVLVSDSVQETEGLPRIQPFESNNKIAASQTEGSVKNVTLLQNGKEDLSLSKTEQKIYDAVDKILRPSAQKEDFSPVLMREIQPASGKATPVSEQIFEKSVLSSLSESPKEALGAAVKTPLPLPTETEDGTQKRNQEASPRLLFVPKTGTILKGTVFSYGADSSAVIATKIGILALENNVKLPDLTPVTVKITDVRLPTLLERDPLPAERNTWTILNHALETLKQTDEAAYDAFKAVLPQAGNKLPALMISFMQAAVREGATVRSWLGEANIAALQKTASGQQILKRLEREFSTSAKKATDGQNVWKGWDIPLLSGSVVEPVSLFLQRPPEDAERREKYAPLQNAVRFVLDMNLSRLGKIQLEGIAGRQKQRFDLIIRHRNDMPPEFEPTVRALFVKTLDALSYAGNLKISKTEEFIDLRPAAETDTAKRGMLV